MGWSVAYPAMIGAVIGAATTDGNAMDRLKGAGIGFGIGMAASYLATEVNWNEVGSGFLSAEEWITDQRWFWQSVKTIDVIIDESIWPEVYQTHLGGIVKNPGLVQPDKSVILDYDSDEKRNRQRRLAAKKANGVIYGSYDGNLYNADEFPYASTIQGGSNAYMHLVNARENQLHGSYLGGLVTRNKMKSGDHFKVILIPNPRKQPIPVLPPLPLPLPPRFPLLPKLNPSMRPIPVPIPLRSPNIFPIIWGPLFENIFFPPSYYKMSPA